MTGSTWVIHKYPGDRNTSPPSPKGRVTFVTVTAEATGYDQAIVPGRRHVGGRGRSPGDRCPITTVYHHRVIFGSTSNVIFVYLKVKKDS